MFNISPSPKPPKPVGESRFAILNSFFPLIVSLNNLKSILNTMLPKDRLKTKAELG